MAFFAAAVVIHAVAPARAALVYDFNDGTLQGWNNRVWDLSANAGAGGWVDLASNVTTMPGTINGGVIQPPGAGNGIFVNNGNRLYPGGDTDAHMNTLWARSPLFYLDGSGNMTFNFLGGASGGTPPTSDASIPYAATAGLWKGLALRDANTGQYVLVKNNTANGGSAQSFTAAELSPFVGSTPYTLDLLNMSRGGWGWIGIDNVVIPGGTTPLGNTWYGWTDAQWSNGANWSSSPPPGAGGTAIFNNAGSGNTTIDLGSGVTIHTVLFDQATVAPYTIGSGAAGSQTLTFNGGGSMALNASVTASQSVNAAVTLGTMSGNEAFVVSNRSTAGGPLLTLAGPVSSATAGTKTLTVNGNGNTAISGIVGDGAGIVAVNKSDPGTLTLTADNTYTGGTTIGGGTVQINKDRALGGVPGAPATNLTFSGSGTLQFAAPGIVLHANRNINVAGGVTATFDTQANDATLGGAVSGAGGLAKTGSGTLTLAAPPSYTGPTTVTAGTLSTADLGATSGVVLGGTGTQGTLAYTGGDATLNGGLTIHAGGGQVAHDGAGTLTIKGGASGTAGGRLTVGGSGNTAIAGSVSLSGGGLTKTGAGTMILSAASTYTGATTISQGTLRLEPFMGPPQDGLAMWLDASDISTLGQNSDGTGAVTAGGQPVGYVADKSGNGRYAIMPTASRRPIYDTTNTIGGLPTLTLSAAANSALWANHNIPNSAAVTLAFVYQQHDLASGNRALFGNDDGGWDRFQGLVGNANYGISNNGWQNYGQAAAMHTTDPLRYMYLSSTPGVPNGSSIWVNGTRVAQFTETHSGGQQAYLTLGNIGQNNSWPGNIRIGEVIGYNRVISDADRNALEAYLNAKWFGGGGAGAGLTNALLPDNSPLSIAGGAVLDVNGVTETIGPLSGAGGIVLGSATPGALTVNSTVDSVFSGTITGNGTFAKTGPGTLTLSGDSTGAGGYTGATTVDAGTLLLSGAILSPVTVNDGGTLAGTGSVGGITLGEGATLSPGTGLVGTLTSTGSVALGAGSVLNFKFNGSANDLVAVTGNVTASGAGVNLYAEGTTNPFSTIGTYSLLSYTGTAGGIDTLSVLSGTRALDRRYAFGTAESGATRYVTLDITSGPVWNGGAAASTWSQAANWSGVAPISDPVHGDVLTFDGAARTTNTNDLVNGQFKGLWFRPTAGSFTLGGNAVTLHGDYNNNAITNDSPNTQTVNLGVTIAAAGKPIHSANSSGHVVLGGTVTAGGNPLLFTGEGNTTISSSGTITGTGGLVKSGTGTLAVNAATSYTGDTRIASGTLRVGHVSALQNTTVDMHADDAGTLGFAAGVTAATLGGLKGGRGIALQNDAAAPVTLSVGNNNQSTAYSGSLSGAGGLTKIGTGTLTLSGTNDYYGDTLLSSGTLTVGTGIPEYRYYRFNTTLTYGGNDRVQMSEVHFRNAGVWVTGATVTAPGATFGSNETPDRLVDNNLGTKSYQQGSGASFPFIFDYGTPQTITEYRWATANDVPNRDPRNYTIDGSHDGITWTTLDSRTNFPQIGRNSWHPIITIASMDNRLSPNSVLTIAAGATLDLADSRQTIAGLSGSGSVVLGPAGTANLTIHNNVNSDFSGVISGAGTVTKRGPATQTFSAGTVPTLHVIEGTANLNSPATATAVNVSGAGTLGLNAAVGTLTVTGGSVQVGAGARAATADFSAGAGTVIANTPLAVSGTMKLPDRYTATFTPGGGATAFHAQSLSGSNIADNNAARTLSLSGGTLTLTPPPTGRLLPVNAAPLMWYDFEDPTNLGKDITGNGYDATVAGSPQAAATAKFGGAIQFNGGQTLEVGNHASLASALTGGDGQSVVMWLKREAGDINVQSTSGIWAGLGSGSNNHWTWDNSFAYLNTFRNGRVENIPVGSSAQQQEWFMVTITRDPANSSTGWKLYFNENQQHQTSIGTLNLGTRWRIGQNESNQFWKGSMDELMVFNQPLTAADVAALYNDPGVYSTSEIDLPGTNIAATGGVTSTLDLGEAGTPSGYHTLGSLILTAGTAASADDTRLELQQGLNLNVQGISALYPAAGTGARTASIADGGSSPVLSLAAGSNVSVEQDVTLTIHSTIGDPQSGATDLTKTGLGTLVLTAANAYTGTTAVNAGTLLVNNTSGSATGTSTVTVGPGGTLGGTGTVGGAVTVHAGGTLAPGASIGTLGLGGSLSLLAGSIFDWEFNSTAQTADLLNVAGPVDLTDSILQLSDLDPTDPLPVGTKFTLLSYAETLVGTFAGLADNDLFDAAGYLWQIDYADTTAGLNGGAYGNFVTLTVAIPEPSSVLLLAFGLLGLLAWGRRRW